MERNTRFIVCDQDSSSFSFNIRSEAETRSDLLSECVDVYASLFEYAHGFIRADSVQFSVRVYSEDYAVTEKYDLEAEPVRFVEFEIAQPNLRSKFVDAYESVSTEGDQIKSISSIKGKEVAARLWFDGTDEYVIPGTEYYQMGYENLDSDEPHPAAKFYPLRIDLTLRSSPSRDSSSTILSLTFNTHTNVWFDENEIGARNRARLAKLFEYVERTHDVTYGDFYGPTYFTVAEDPEKLRSIDPTEYLNAELDYQP